MKLRRFGVSVALALSAAVALAGPAMASPAHDSASVTLQCFDGPCASDSVNSGPDGSLGWNGEYRAVQTVGIPANSPVLIQAIKPNGQPYPAGQYTTPGTLPGVQGNGDLESTDPHGQLIHFRWAGLNGLNTPTDPSGTYTLTFHFYDAMHQLRSTTASLYMSNVVHWTPSTGPASVNLTCLEGPCYTLGVNSGPDGSLGWNGNYVAGQTTGLAPNTKLLVQAFYPNGTPYPAGNYTNSGTLFGLTGELLYSDPHGNVSSFMWAGYNGPNGTTDPRGDYTLVFYYENNAGQVVDFATTANMSGH